MGRFNGSIEEQIQVLEAAIAAGAKAVDVEIESAEVCGPRLEALRAHAYVMLSYHNYGGTPATDPIMRRMQKVPADGYKIVTTAKKPSDNCRVLELARSYPKTHTVLLAMGETGFPTRVLSTGFGGLYTYAAPNAANGTAAGQVSARQLRNLYRVEKISRDAKIYGVIADPVRHSISPMVHNRAFQARRIDAVYLPFLVHPDWRTSCRSQASVSRFRTSRKSSAIWTTSIRWHGGSEPSIRFGANPANGEAQTPMRMA
jgi:3-dehydroquinate dehydratase/shikimate dehydrogenase